MSDKHKEPYEEYMVTDTMFNYFMVKMYGQVQISDPEKQEIHREFAKYLHGRNFTELQIKNVMPKNEVDIILNMDNPFRTHGFPPGYVLHFCQFIDEMKEKLGLDKEQGETKQQSDDERR